MKGTVEQTDINILIGSGVTAADRDLFFGPLESEDKFHVLVDESSMCDILVVAGIFDSKTSARKNGWGKQQPAAFKQNVRIHDADVVFQSGMIVPNGFTIFRAGKGKAVRIAILKIV